MKTRLLWFVALCFLISVAVFATATPIARMANKTASKSATPAGMQLASPTANSQEASISAADSKVSQALAGIQQKLDVLRQFRAAKAAHQKPGNDLYRQLFELNPPAHRGSGHLDQGGETCADATVIATVPYSDFGTTAGYADNYNPNCPYDGAPGNSPDVVYAFTPAATSNYHISLCGSTYDTRLFVYAGVCSGDPIACNDDSPNCAPSSEIASVELAGGTTYYIVVDGYGDGSFGDYNFFMEEVAPPPTGDVCTDPIVVPSLPFNVQDATTCGFNGDYTGTCLSVADGGNDVIYSFTLTAPTSVEVILNPHVGTPPMETYVWPGVLVSDHCPPDWSCIASASNMTVDLLYVPCGLLQPGTYYVMVDNCNWFQTCYSYDLTIQQTVPCNITSQPGDVPEVAEPFPVNGTFSVNDLDGGCNDATPQFQTISGNQTIFGRTFFYADSMTNNAVKADMDWYRIVLATPQTMTCNYVGESLLRVDLLQPPCPGIIALNGTPSTPCSQGTISQCLEPGEYFVRISRGGTASAPDAQTYAYRAAFSFVPCTLPIGRCCYAETCANNTHPECVALTGTWFAGLTCDTPCPYIPPNDNCQNAGTPATLPATFTGDNTNATNDCPLFEGQPQVWHVFMTTETQDVMIDYCGTQNFHSFNQYIYNGCPCAERTEMNMVDWGQCDPTSFTGIWRNLPAGTWYISVPLWIPNSVGPYTIHVRTIPAGPPANDECSTATPITLVPFGSVNVTGTTINANTSCTQICNENGFDYSSSGGDVFYSLTLTECRRIAIALGIGDMHVAVYQGLGSCCTDPALLCNDDDSHFTALPSWDVPEQHPGDPRSYVAAALDPGTYIIRVAKYASQSGYYSLTVYDNGPCHCLPPEVTDLTTFCVGNNVELRWTTDAVSATRGTYRIYSNTNDAPAGDPSWTLEADNILPVVGTHHLYYTAPLTSNERKFYYVTGVCTDNP